MKYRELKILDIEESEDGNKLEVPFEVPGDKFDQSYPKRLTHTFPKKQKFFDEVEDGVRRYEKIIRELYLEKEQDKKEREEVDKKLDKVRKEVKGKNVEVRKQVKGENVDKETSV